MEMHNLAYLTRGSSPVHVDGNHNSLISTILLKPSVEVMVRLTSLQAEVPYLVCAGSGEAHSVIDGGWLAAVRSPSYAESDASLHLTRHHSQPRRRWLGGKGHVHLPFICADGAKRSRAAHCSLKTFVVCRMVRCRQQLPAQVAEVRLPLAALRRASHEVAAGLSLTQATAHWASLQILPGDEPAELGIHAFKLSSLAAGSGMGRLATARTEGTGTERAANLRLGCCQLVRYEDLAAARRGAVHKLLIGVRLGHKTACLKVEQPPVQLRALRTSGQQVSKETLWNGHPALGQATAQICRRNPAFVDHTSHILLNASTADRMATRKACIVNDIFQANGTACYC